MTKLCNSCEYLKFCARSGIEEVGCDRYKRDTTTNEEWFCQLPTGEKAAVLNLKFNSANVCRLPTYDEIVEWLKEKHDG